jgi:hypothetical protein
VESSEELVLLAVSKADAKACNRAVKISIVEEQLLELFSAEPSVIVLIISFEHAGTKLFKKLIVCGGFHQGSCLDDGLSGLTFGNGKKNSEFFKR